MRDLFNTLIDSFNLGGDYISVALTAVYILDGFVQAFSFVVFAILPAAVFTPSCVYVFTSKQYFSTH